MLLVEAMGMDLALEVMGTDLTLEERVAAVGQIRLLGSVRVLDLVFEERVAVF